MKVKHVHDENEFEDEVKVRTSAEFRYDQHDHSTRRYSLPPFVHILQPSTIFCSCHKLRKITELYGEADDGLICRTNNDSSSSSNNNNNILANGLNDGGAVYLTKRSLMLNQFFNYADTTSKSSPPATTNVDKGNRFQDYAHRQRLLQAHHHHHHHHHHRRRAHSPILANDCRVAKGGANLELAVVKGRQDRSSDRSAYLTGSIFADRSVNFGRSIFTDERFVSVVRSIALYWFFCLNTVLARGDDARLRRSTSTSLASFEFDDDNNMFAWSFLQSLASHSSSPKFGEMDLVPGNGSRSICFTNGDDDDDDESWRSFSSNASVSVADGDVGTSLESPEAAAATATAIQEQRPAYWPNGRDTGYGGEAAWLPSVWSWNCPPEPSPTVYHTVDTRLMEEAVNEYRRQYACSRVHVSEDHKYNLWESGFDVGLGSIIDRGARSAEEQPSDCVPHCCPTGHEDSLFRTVGTEQPSASGNNASYSDPLANVSEPEMPSSYWNSGFVSEYNGCLGWSDSLRVCDAADRVQRAPKNARILVNDGDDVGAFKIYRKSDVMEAVLPVEEAPSCGAPENGLWSRAESVPAVEASSPSTDEDEDEEIRRYSESESCFRPIFPVRNVTVERCVFIRSISGAYYFEGKKFFPYRTPEDGDCSENVFTPKCEFRANDVGTQTTNDADEWWSFQRDEIQLMDRVFTGAFSRRSPGRRLFYPGVGTPAASTFGYGSARNF